MKRSTFRSFLLCFLSAIPCSSQLFITSLPHWLLIPGTTAIQPKVPSTLGMPDARFFSMEHRLGPHPSSGLKELLSFLDPLYDGEMATCSFLWNLS